MHAYLRDGDQYADIAEQEDREQYESRTRARQEVRDEVDRLRSCGVRVRYSRAEWAPDEAAHVVQALDDATWHVILPWPDDQQDWEELRRTLGWVWHLLSTKTDAENDCWYVAAAKPDDPLSYPYRRTALLRRSRG